MKYLLIAFLLVSFSGGDSGVDQKPYHNSTYDSPELQAAFAEARASLPIFWAELETPAPDTRLYQVRVRQPLTERAKYRYSYIWFENVERNGEEVSGEIDLRASLIKGDHKAGDRLTFPETDIVDWRFIGDGNYYGFFTHRASFAYLERKGIRSISPNGLYHDDPLPPPRE